jgi:hypothetical protein
MKDDEARLAFVLTGDLPASEAVSMIASMFDVTTVEARALISRGRTLAALDGRKSA